MDTPKYTKKDMKRFAEMCEESSPMLMILEEVDHDPIKLRDKLEEYGLHKDIKYIFETPLDEIPLLLDKKEIAGYMSFRLDIGK